MKIAYRSSYYWNFRTSSFKQVACLILEYTLVIRQHKPSYNTKQTTNIGQNLTPENSLINTCIYFILEYINTLRGRRGRDLMVVGFTTTCAISAYYHKSCEFETHSGEVYSIQHYVIKIISDLWQVGGFLWVLQFPPPIKLTTTI